MTARPPISGAALDALLDSMRHAKGSAFLRLLDFELTEAQRDRVAKWLDSRVPGYKPGRGGQKAEWKATALLRVRELINEGHSESTALERAASESRYDLATLSRYWRDAKRRRAEIAAAQKRRKEWAIQKWRNDPEFRKSRTEYTRRRRRGFESALSESVNA